MKCESCGASTTINYGEIINHGKKSVVLCEACYEEEFNRFAETLQSNEKMSIGAPATVQTNKTKNSTAYGDGAIFGILSIVLFIGFIFVWTVNTFTVSLIPLALSAICLILAYLMTLEGENTKLEEENTQKSHMAIQKLREEGYSDTDGVKRLANKGRVNEAVMLYRNLYPLLTPEEAEGSVTQMMRNDIFSSVIDEQVDIHLKVLLRNRKKLIYEDDYGIKDYSAWNAELERFAENIILPKLSVRGYYSDKYTTADAYNISYRQERDKDKAASTIESRLSNYNPDQANIDFYETMSPEDFEYFCSAILDQSGWNTKLTRSSGDQGIDIIAEREGFTIVIQCKKYSSPIGNKSVQEAIAGKTYIGADGAVVVANSSFTKSAKELARTSDVKLLHYDELGSLNVDDFL